MTDIGISETQFQAQLAQWDIPGFLVSHEVTRFADAMLAEEADHLESWANVPIPSDARRHAQAMAFAIPASDTEYLLFALDEPAADEPGSLNSIVLSWLGEWSGTSRAMISLGRFEAGRGFIVGVEHQGADDADNMAYSIALLAYILSLINQPRILAKQPLLSRQSRRAAQRGGAKAVDAWHKVTFDLSRETAAKVTRDPDYHKVPLHWRRGHFRRALPHYRGAIQRLDAIRPEDRDLWWQWIEGQWVGHPAFGLKKSVHAPKLSTGKLARRLS
jgi:hypothetical protein